MFSHINKKQKLYNDVSCVLEIFASIKDMRILNEKSLNHGDISKFNVIFNGNDYYIIDFDETCKQAAKRELKEETGLSLSISKFTLVGINDDPTKDKRQNITFRYLARPDSYMENLMSKLSDKDSEKDEVQSIKFIPIDDIHKYEWAFNHDTLLETKLLPRRASKIGDLYVSQISQSYSLQSFRKSIAKSYELGSLRSSSSPR